MKTLTPQAAPAAPTTLAAPRGRLLQRKCACGGSAGLTGACEECGGKLAALRRSASGEAAPASAPSVVHEVLASPGRPLDPATRSHMEAHFGHDFSRVRVHADSRAAESARSVGAHAYTVGHDIAFDAGRYAPATREGQRLLAHELAHTVQQGRVARPAGQGFGLGAPGDAAELEADRAADAVMAGAPVALRPVASPTLARQSAGPSVPGPSPTPSQEAQPGKKKEDMSKVGVSRERGRHSTWGWGAPETNNIYYDCVIAPLKRSSFLEFMASLPSSSRKPQGRREKNAPTITLGITEAFVEQAEPPKIELTPAQTRKNREVYKLKPTRAVMPPIKSAYTQEGDFVEGKVASGAEGCGAERAKLSAQTGEAKFPVNWKILAGGAAAIRAGEKEHCDDIRHAFDITLALYASGINNEAAADREYGSRESAMKDIISRIGVKPGEMLRNFIKTAGKTTTRDSNNWHTPNAKGHESPSPENGCRAIETINAVSLPEVGKHPSSEVIE